MEEMMMMINSNSPENISISEQPITTSTCPSWKLYENPFFYFHHHQHDQQHLHNLNPPLSARKIAASFWDLTFSRPIMDSELDIAHAQITELKAELEFERRARKKAEAMNKRLAKDLAEEKRGREAMERICGELARQISSDKGEIDRMKREMEDERKMLRVAEVLREERVQMKLAEAKIIFEEKMSELEITKHNQIETSSSKTERKNQEDCSPRITTTDSVFSRKISRLVLVEKAGCNENNNGCVSSMAIQKRASAEAENPHIRRGIKGFVEFPRVVRAIGSKSRHWGTKLECQKAQLRILLKQKSPIRSNGLIMS